MGYECIYSVLKWQLELANILVLYIIIIKYEIFL